MRFDGYQVGTGLEEHGGRVFGIHKNMVGATNAGLWRSGISSSSSLSGPGTDFECGEIAGEV